MNAHDDPSFAFPPRLVVHDRVITPSDEVAFVLRERNAEGFVSVRYAEALRRDHAEVHVREPLLARWDEGKPRPRPVRVTFARGRP